MAARRTLADVMSRLLPSFVFMHPEVCQDIRRALDLIDTQITASHALDDILLARIVDATTLDVVVRDDHAGKPNVYTVFRIDRTKKTSTIIGRELDIATAEKL